MRAAAPPPLDLAQPPRSSAAPRSGKMARMTPEPQAPRLFVALWPTEPLARMLHDWAAAQGIPRTVAVERLHLTLHFLGAVPHARWPALIEGLSVPVRPFTLELGACAAWPRGLLVALPRAVPDALGALHEALAQALRRLELPVERRPYRPHVTLSRHAATVPIAALPLLRWPVRGYVLAQSVPGPQSQAAHSYRVLQAYR